MAEEQEIGPATDLPPGKVIGFGAYALPLRRRPVIERNGNLFLQ